MHGDFVRKRNISKDLWTFNALARHTGLYKPTCYRRDASIVKKLAATIKFCFCYDVSLDNNACT
jgi:hypothetical protein